MGVDELRDSVNGIRMTEDMRTAVIENVRRRTGHSTGKGNRDVRPGRHTRRAAAGWGKHLAAAALAVMVIGAAAVPVRAFVNSLIKERMEEMPQEEKDTYVETLEEQEAEADSYTREYTKSEEARYREMAGRYQEGAFPEQGIVQVDSEEEAAGYEFCYLKPTSTFCLPKRELTDEELLQIIDFVAKREYAYREDYEKEHAEEIAAKEEQEKAEIAENVEEGGITEQQAVEIATRKLSEVFGMATDGFEMNSYYNEGGDGRAANYCVNWTNIISHQYYYFYIDAGDGHMIWAEHSGADIHEEPETALEEAKGRIPELQAKAAECMENIVGEPYRKVYVYYLEYGDGSAGRSVRFYFVGEDQGAYAITYTWGGTMYSIEEKDVSGLQDGQERELWNGEEYIKANVVFQEIAG